MEYGWRQNKNYAGGATCWSSKWVYIQFQTQTQLSPLLDLNPRPHGPLRYDDMIFLWKWFVAKIKNTWLNLLSHSNLFILRRNKLLVQSGDPLKGEFSDCVIVNDNEVSCIIKCYFTTARLSITIQSYTKISNIHIKIVSICC